MKALHKKKKNMVTYCERTMKQEELKADKKSVIIMEELKAKKKHAYRVLDDAQDKLLALDEVQADLIKAVNETEDKLMEIEMILQDALHTAFTAFKDMTQAITNQQKEKIMDFIKKVQDAADEFNKEFFPYACKEQIDFIEEFTAKQERGEAFDDEGDDFNDKLVVLGEKDDLIQMLEQSKDFIEKKINEKEIIINKGIGEEANRIQKTIETHQKKRNRGIVKDIINTCNGYRNEIATEFNNMRDDADEN